MLLLQHMSTILRGAMPQHKSREVRVWSRLLIVAVIGVLTFNLVTRYSAPHTGHVNAGKTLQRWSPEPKRQHLNRDEAQWAAPVVSFSAFTPPFLSFRIPNLDLPFCRRSLDRNLYNRPPPSA